MTHTDKEFNKMVVDKLVDKFGGDYTKEELTELLKRLEIKYGGKGEYSPTELNQLLMDIEKKYGDKMATGNADDMTNPEELIIKHLYDTIVEMLQKTSPGWLKAHENYVNAIKFQNYGSRLRIFIKDNIWIVVGVLLAIAILKYIFS